MTSKNVVCLENLWEYIIGYKESISFPESSFLLWKEYISLMMMANNDDIFYSDEELSDSELYQVKVKLFIEESRSS